MTVAVTEAPACAVVVFTASVGLVTIVNGSAADVPPPGGGVKTVTCALPTAATSLAGIVACSSVEFVNVVGRSAPFNRTTDDEMKLLPLTISVNDETPAATLAGLSEMIAGRRLYVGSTVTAALVAARAPLTKSRNS